MRIRVINGSPKGVCSVTLQTVRYLDKTIRSMHLRCFMRDNGPK